MSLFTYWKSILIHLRQPEYVHVLLNPIPIYGLALGSLALVIAMILRSRQAQITALILILIGAASTIPVIYFGDQGYDTIEAKMPTDQADAWLDAHGQRALRARVWFDVLIGVSLIALLAPIKWPKSRHVLNALTLAFAIVDFCLAGWIGYAGGQAMHEEFRSGMPVEPVGGYDKVR
ncbi:MAG: hypothetical protein ABSE62_03875 [Chthoniobacteraceae bacterium]|jgi:hypothetical protein